MLATNCLRFRIGSVLFSLASERVILKIGTSSGMRAHYGVTELNASLLYTARLLPEPIGKIVLRCYLCVELTTYVQ